MKRWIYFGVLTLTSPVWAGNVPNQITYQGTLKETGVPVNAVRTMQFRLTNADGTAVYWSSGNQSITVANGFFSAALSPSGVDWQNVVPYIELSVEGQLMLPREKVSANAYAFLSRTVVDGSVTIPKLANDVHSYLVPAGLIAMFATSCPNGWTRFSALDGAFPMGGATYGTLGGSAEHTHTTPNHQHALGVVGGFAAGCFAGPIGIVAGGGPALVAIPTGSNCGYQQVGNITTNSGAGTTGPTNHLPPYKTVVFCQKQ